MKKRSLILAVIIGAALFVVPQLCFSGQILDAGYTSQSNSIDFNVVSDLKVKPGKAVVASVGVDDKYGGSGKVLSSFDVGESIDSDGLGKFTQTDNDNSCVSCHSIDNIRSIPDI